MPIKDIIVQGEKARLFPVVAETSKENRIASIFLALLPEIPGLAKDLLQSANTRVGKRSTIECYTEVFLKNDTDKNDKPDGLICVKTGSKSWLALVEPIWRKIRLSATSNLQNRTRLMLLLL